MFGVHGGAARIDGRAVMQRVRELRDYFVGSVLEVVEDFPAQHRLAGHARFLDDHRLQIGDDTVVEADGPDRHGLPAHLPFLPGRGRRSARDQRRRVRVAGPARVGRGVRRRHHRPRARPGAASPGVRMRLFGKGGAVGPLSDPAVKDYAAKTFAAEFPFDPDAKVGAVRRRDGQIEVEFEDKGTERFDRLLAATGDRTSTGSVSRTPLSSSTTGACRCSTASPGSAATATSSSPATPTTRCRCCTRRRTRARSPATTPGATRTCAPRAGARRSASCSPIRRSRSPASPGGSCRPRASTTPSARCRSRIRAAAG